MIRNEILRVNGENSCTCVRKLTLTNFRNYRSLDLEMGKRFNVLAGKNGQGKTNLLEALHLLSTTRLLRGQKDVEAIQDDSNSASVTAELEPLHTQLSMNLERGVRKRASLNGLKLPRASDLLGRLACVCVSSEDMEIVRGEPANRRLFLDLELSAALPAYLRHLSVYKRALEQRNALIKVAKDNAVPPAQWEVWEDQLAEHGNMIRRMRAEYVADLKQEMPDLHREIGGGESCGLQVVGKQEPDSKGALLDVYADSRTADVWKGTTSVGPHRDDVDFQINGRSARLFGSQGQQRTFVISLKLATLVLGAKRKGEPPLLLLDDIFSDLDYSRRESLVDTILALAGQTVLTCTEPEAAGAQILGHAQIYRIEEGVVFVV